MNKEIELSSTINRFASLVGENTAIKVGAETHEFLDQACDIIESTRSDLEAAKAENAVMRRRLAVIASVIDEHNAETEKEQEKTTNDTI